MGWRQSAAGHLCCARASGSSGGAETRCTGPQHNSTSLCRSHAYLQQRVADDGRGPLPRRPLRHRFKLPFALAARVFVAATPVNGDHLEAEEGERAAVGWAGEQGRLHGAAWGARAAVGAGGQDTLLSKYPAARLSGSQQQKRWRSTAAASTAWAATPSAEAQQRVACADQVGSTPRSCDTTAATAASKHKHDTPRLLPYPSPPPPCTRGMCGSGSALAATDRGRASSRGGRTA